MHYNGFWNTGYFSSTENQTGVKGPPYWRHLIFSFLLAPVHNYFCTKHKFLLPKSTHALTRIAYIFNHLKAALYKEEEEEERWSPFNIPKERPCLTFIIQSIDYIKNLACNTQVYDLRT